MIDNGSINLHHTYVGDGVYAEFDGFGLLLRANNHQDHLCTDKIYLEPQVLNNINKFYRYVLQEK